MSEHNAEQINKMAINKLTRNADAERLKGAKVLRSSDSAILFLLERIDARDTALRDKDAEIARLRNVAEAARPIASAAADLLFTTSDRSEIWELPAAMSITAGALRRLEKALATLDAAPKTAAPDNGWRPIETAPTDGTFVWVWAAPKHGLPGFVEYARYHADAGWCVDELREVTLWFPALPPPAPREGEGNGDL